MHKALKWFAIITTIGLLFVLIGGALVTKTGSGAGCGDSWPLCNGELIPTTITFELIIELSHRVVSGTVGILVVILAIWSWKRLGHVRETKALAILSVVFLILQALLGAGAVMWGQSSTILALHFGISLISFASVLLLTFLIFEEDKKWDRQALHIDKPMRKQILWLTIYSYLVVYTGALVRHKSASLACLDWPLCGNEGALLPQHTGQWIQMGHRFAAGVIFIWILALTIRAVRHYHSSKAIYYGMISSLILVSLQVGTGAFIIFTKLNLYIALLHAFFISCLFGVLSYLLLLASRSKKAEETNGKEVA